MELIESILIQVRRLPSSLLLIDATEGSLLSKAGVEAQEVSKELASVLQDCTREVGESNNKRAMAKKRRWLVETGKIEKLQGRLRHATDLLHLAVSHAHYLLTSYGFANITRSTLSLKDCRTC